MRLTLPACPRCPFPVHVQGVQIDRDSALEILAALGVEITSIHCPAHAAEISAEARGYREGPWPT